MYTILRLQCIANFQRYLVLCVTLNAVKRQSRDCQIFVRYFEALCRIVTLIVTDTLDTERRLPVTDKMSQSIGNVSHLLQRRPRPRRIKCSLLHKDFTGDIPSMASLFSSRSNSRKAICSNSTSFDGKK